MSFVPEASVLVFIYACVCEAVVRTHRVLAVGGEIIFRRAHAAEPPLARGRGALGGGAVDADEHRVVDDLELLEQRAILLDLREEPSLLITP